MIVGGRRFRWDYEDVKKAMRNQVPETPQKWVTWIGDQPFPPKQVIAQVTGWDRQSFTTMEARRVLAKVGFDSWDVDWNDPGDPVVRRNGGPVTARTPDPRIASLEAALATAQEAIAGLAARVRVLEGTEQT